MLEVTPMNVHCGRCARERKWCPVHTRPVKDISSIFAGMVRYNYESKHLAAYGDFIDKTMLPPDNRTPLDDDAYGLQTAAAVVYYRKCEGSV